MHYLPELCHGARADDGWTYRGLKTVVIENEHLRVEVTADKGADITSLVHKPTDTEYMWRSPTGLRDPSRFVPSTGHAVQVWLDHYQGGWQTIVPAGGLPSTYKGSDQGQHGEANLLPWDATIVEPGPERALVRFHVHLARTPLSVIKEVELRAGDPTMRVRERVENLSPESIELSYGQHIAFGPPFLSGDCVIDLPGGTVLTHPESYAPNNRLRPGSSTPWPIAPGIDGKDVDLRRVPPHGSRIDDQVYVTDLADGWYALTNQSTGVGVAVRFPAELYRYLWYWQMFGGGTGYPFWGRAYTCGLEPFTSWPNTGLADTVANGTALALGPGEHLASEILVTPYAMARGVSSVDANGSVTLVEA